MTTKPYVNSLHESITSGCYRFEVIEIKEVIHHPLLWHVKLKLVNVPLIFHDTIHMQNLNAFMLSIGKGGSYSREALGSLLKQRGSVKLNIQKKEGQFEVRIDYYIPKRIAETKTKFQVYGLLKLEGMLDLFNIQLGEDLEGEAKSKALQLKMLLQQAKRLQQPK